MNNGEKALTQQKILVVAAIISIIALLLVIVLPRFINSVGIPLPDDPLINHPQLEGETAETKLPDEGGSGNIQPILTDATATPVFFTRPTIGTVGVNLPNNFKVENWRNNSCETSSSPYTVELYGVEIYGEASSYGINFMGESTEIAALYVSSTSNYFEFSPAIVIPRNEYIQVIITYELNGVKSEWIDHIYYLDKNSCVED